MVSTVRTQGPRGLGGPGPDQTAAQNLREAARVAVVPLSLGPQLAQQGAPIQVRGSKKILG